MYVDSAQIQDSADGAANNGFAEPAILCVDDDPCILDGLRRQLRKKFRIRIAVGGFEGLEIISNSGPFGVVMSDLQMPGMDGIEFLARVRSISPETVRVMLTGRADVSTAMAAVNQGNIFRFLVKPCTPVVIEKVLEAALEQHRVLDGVKRLTHDTLLASVEVLVEMLSLTQPKAFDCGMRARRHVREIAAIMGLKETWELEAAATLSQMGWITLDADILAKAAGREPMSEEDQTRFEAHASAAARMLEKIPRLGHVAAMIENQHFAPKVRSQAAAAWNVCDPNLVAAEVLRAVVDFDTMHQKGVRHLDVVNKMHNETGVYMPEVIAAMKTVAEKAEASEVKFVTVGTLEAGQVLEESLRGQNGRLLLGKGEELNGALISRLRSLGLPPGQKVRIRSVGFKPF